MIACGAANSSASLQGPLKSLAKTACARRQPQLERTFACPCQCLACFGRENIFGRSWNFGARTPSPTPVERSATAGI